MAIIEFLPALPVVWLLLKAARKGWRLFSLLCFAALITGCASTSNKFEKSPCACDFELINKENHRGRGHA